ncbi:MAG: metal ABC transporter permease [Candidatus Omnitrophota bacterium]
MEEFLRYMTWPFLACLVLTGIHAYLGLHVIERQVIFVDLALAQIAALGAGVALLFHHGFDTPGAYWFSLGFTVIGAAVFSFSRFRQQKVPQEAVIGIVYAVSAAFLMLVLSRSGEGDEHVRHVFLGNILLVTPREVIKMALIYAVIGVFHFIWRGPFLLISQNAEEAFQKGLPVRSWDFLFYTTFGIVVTSSVRIAGVLLVFSYLVVPAASAVMFVSGARARLLFGWAVGFFASVAGITASYILDIPTGATVVCVFGLTILLLAFIRRMIPGY